MENTRSPIDPLDGISEAEQITGYDRTSIWRKGKTGEFPQPIYVGNRRKWRRSVLLAWVEAQAARPPGSRRSNLAGAK